MLLLKEMKFDIRMNNYLPSYCERRAITDFDNTILDIFFIDGKVKLKKFRSNGVIRVKWNIVPNESSKTGLLYLRMSPNGTQIALVSPSSDPTDQPLETLTQLENYNITTGIVIPKSVSNSFMTRDKLILFANRYYVELPFELDKWVPLEVKNFSSVICRTDENRSITTTESKTTPNTTSGVIIETTTQTPTTSSTPTTLSTSQSTEPTTVSTQSTTTETTTTTPSTSTSEREDTTTVSTVETKSTTLSTVSTTTTTQTTTTTPQTTTLSTTFSTVSTTIPTIVSMSSTSSEQTAEQTFTTTQMTATTLKTTTLSTTLSTVSTTISTIASIETKTTLSSVPITSTTRKPSNSSNTTEPTNSSDELFLILIIVILLVVVPLVLGLIVFIIYMNVKSDRREEATSVTVKSSSSDQSFKSSGVTQSFDVKSSRDYAKTIEKNSGSVTQPSTVPSATVKGPTDLKVK